MAFSFNLHLTYGKTTGKAWWYCCEQYELFVICAIPMKSSWYLDIFGVYLSVVMTSLSQQSDHEPCLQNKTIWASVKCIDSWDVIINNSTPYNFVLFHWQHFAWSHILSPGLYQVHSQLHWSSSTYLSILKISKLFQNSHGSSKGQPQSISTSWKITFLMQAPPIRQLLN